MDIYHDKEQLQDDRKMLKEAAIQMFKLGISTEECFKSIANLDRATKKFEKYDINTLLREHYYNEFGEYPEYIKPHICNCDCCGYEDWGY